MPDDETFIFDQVTLVIFFGEFCAIMSGNHIDLTFKLDHWLPSKTRQTFTA